MNEANEIEKIMNNMIEEIYLLMVKKDIKKAQLARHFNIAVNTLKSLLESRKQDYRLLGEILDYCRKLEK